MDEVKQIVSDIKKGNIKPIYFLMGEESYYIDKISEYIDKNVLAEEEKGFNQMVLYGRDVSIEDIVSNAKRYPMMADRQVLIVKEAQDLSRTIEKLANYAENPQPTTVLVVCYKYKKIDKRKKLYKTIAQNGIIYESKKLYENQVADWIKRVLAGAKYNIEPKASQMLVEFLGTDLSKINNELQKLKLIFPIGTLITADSIEENIGISKEFNNFELRKAIGLKDIVKSYRIINYFDSFFSQVLQYHGLSDKSQRNVASVLKVNPYFVSDYADAARNYPMKKVSRIITLLREADVKSKGVGAANIPSGDILKELLVKIIG